MTDKNEMLEDEYLEYLADAQGIVVGYMSQKLEGTPDWDEISAEDNPGRIRVFITDEGVHLPPNCAPVISALLEDAGLKSIPVTYEHSEPIELY